MSPRLHGAFFGDPIRATEQYDYWMFKNQMSKAEPKTSGLVAKLQAAYCICKYYSCSFLTVCLFLANICEYLYSRSSLVKQCRKHILFLGKHW